MSTSRDKITNKKMSVCNYPGNKLWKHKQGNTFDILEVLTDSFFYQEKVNCSSNMLMTNSWISVLILRLFNCLRQSVFLKNSFSSINSQTIIWMKKFSSYFIVAINMKTNKCHFLSSD